MSTNHPYNSSHSEAPGFTPGLLVVSVVRIHLVFSDVVFVLHVFVLCLDCFFLDCPLASSNVYTMYTMHNFSYIVVVNFIGS